MLELPVNGCRQFLKLLCEAGWIGSLSGNVQNPLAKLSKNVYIAVFEILTL